MQILIVDDEKIIADGLKVLVQKLGIREIERVRTSYRPADALDIAQGMRPDILLTDIRMPRMSGLELISRMRRSIPTLRAIVVTGHDDFELVREALRIETIDYLLKPATREEVRRALTRAVEEVKHDHRDEALDETLLFTSIIDTAWPWIAERAPLSSESQHRLATTLEDVYGLRRLALVAIEGVGLDAPSLVTDIERATKTASREVRSTTHRDAWTLFVVLAGRHREEVELVSDAIARHIRSATELMATITAPRRGLSSMPAAFETLRVARLRKLTNGARVAIREPESTPPVFDRLTRDQAAELVSAASPVADTPTVVSMITSHAHQPARLARIWVECRDLIEDRGGGKLPPPERFMQIDDLVQALIATCRAPNVEHDSEHVVIRKARKFVADHFHEQHTMADVASALGVSYSYFSTLFREVTGETFSGYLTRFRMERARHLLDEVALPVWQVASSVGYRYAKHFTRAFKRYFGVTPQEYLTGAESPP